MARIFISLVFAEVTITIATVVLGLNIEDRQARDANWHIITGVGTAVFGALVHGITFTYFMGTGRWVEETSRAYQLGDTFLQRHRTLKYRMLPGLTAALVLLVLLVASGAASDPASVLRFKGWFGLSAAEIHLTAAIVVVTANLLVHIHEFRCIENNSGIVEEVLAEVRRIRADRGLDT